MVSACFSLASLVASMTINKEVQGVEEYNKEAEEVEDVGAVIA